jgi:hypothetical protein
MKESTTYQAIVEEGRVDEARRMLLLQGEARFGPPDAVTRATFEKMQDVAQLEQLFIRLVSVGSWQELVPPPARRRNGRRRHP